MTQQTYSVEELKRLVDIKYTLMGSLQLQNDAPAIAQQLLEREGHYEDLLEQSVIFIKENESLRAKLDVAKQAIEKTLKATDGWTVFCEESKILNEAIAEINK